MPTNNTYLVGGAVRDALLGLSVQERDYVVVGSTADEMLAQGYTQVGKDFPVFLHPQTKEEYALARTERKSGQGYKGFEVHAAKSVTLEEDLLRRDLTINAIAQTQEGKLIDPFGGQQDLNAKVLRHVSQAFSEDPLRVLRTARFAAHLHHLGFSIAPPTKALLTEITLTGELSTLAKERVWQETQKALGTKSPWVYFEVLEACQALQELMPAVAELLQRRPKALATLKVLSEQNTNTKARLSGLLYQLNKPQIEELASHIKMPGHVKDLALSISNYQRQLRAYSELDATQKHQVLSNLGLLKSTGELDQLLHLCEAIAKSHEPLFGWPSPKQEILLDIERVLSVKPAELMAQGYSGKALGEALKKAQIEAITL